MLEGFCKIPHHRKDKKWYMYIQFLSNLKLAVWQLERLEFHYYHHIF